MAMITIWHNPRCSKSRQTLALIEQSGLPFTIRKYLDVPPTITELKTTRKALGDPAVIDMMRPSEAQFKALGLTKESNEDRLMQAMADHPILIERPIVFKGDKAVIGRPPENVEALM